MMQPINLYDISRHRGALMGISILIIILFHVYLPQSSEWFGLRRMGNVGVDVFLFLSGMGLWFSWSKIPQLGSGKAFLKEWYHFYVRRLIRIYPAWIAVAGTFYISRFDGEHWIDLAGDILINWDFWIRDELTFWYVPATMMLYIFAPPYMELVRRQPTYRWLVALMLMWPIMVQYITPIHQAVGHIEIFWSRVPIFFLGINIGEAIRRKEALSSQAIWLVVMLFVVSLGSCVWLEQMRHGRFPLYTERMLYIPLAVTGILLASHLLNNAPKWLGSALTWVGAISLEIYLVHIEFVMKPIQAYHLGYWPTALLTMLISIPIAFVLQKVLALIVNKIQINKHKK